MVSTWVVVAVSVAYLGVLFAIAWFGDRQAARGRSIISNGYIYALSIAVYATSWTYYGSVGSAAEGGIAWLPIYLGPMVVVILWWVVLRKIIRICKRDRITSLADFVSARYGKSQLLGGLVTVIAVLGLVPYIALQLKAISTTFTILRSEAGAATTGDGAVPLLQDTGLYAALMLAAFTIVFGTRHLDATERHEGMVAAIAFESLVKLVAFLVVGAWVTYGLFDGFSDVVERAAERPELAELMTLSPNTGYDTFFWLTVLSMLAFLLLPRQWQVSVVENVDERHLRTAMWLFPLYLLHLYHYIAVGGGLLAGIAATVGMVILIYRRRTVGPVFSATTVMDKVMYLFLALAIFLGMWNTIAGSIFTLGGEYNYREGVSVWYRSFLAFQPEAHLMAEAPLGFQLHALVAFVLFALWPFTRLVHVFSAPLGYFTRPYIVYRSRDDHELGSHSPRRGWERIDR